MSQNTSAGGVRYTSNRRPGPRNAVSICASAWTGPPDRSPARRRRRQRRNRRCKTTLRHLISSKQAN